jgi:hypothetical protein
MYPVWPELYVSVYRRPGRILYIIHNNSATQGTVQIRPNWSAIGFAERPLIDAYHEQRIPAPAPGASFLAPGLNGYSRINIAPWSFKAIVIRDN